MDASRCMKVRFWVLTGSAWALGIALTDSLARFILVSSIPLLIIFGALGLDYFIDRPQNRLWRLQKLAEEPLIGATERSKRQRVLQEYEAELQQLQIKRVSEHLPPWQCILGQRGRRIFGETRRANGKADLLAAIGGGENHAQESPSVDGLEQMGNLVSNNPNPDADSQALPSKWTEGIKESGRTSAKTSERPHTESSNAVLENQTSSRSAEKMPERNGDAGSSSGGPKKTQVEKWLEIDRKYQERDRIRKEREQAAEKLKVRMEEILRYFANSTKYLSLEDNPASLAQALWLQTRIRPTPQEFGVSDRGAELLAAQWLRYLGEEEVIVTQYSQDGGVDVLTENFACQVKNYSKMKVSLSEIRDLLGTAHSLGLKPILLTSSTSTPSGLEFATQNKIAVIRYSTEDSTLSPLTPMGLALLNQGRYEP